MSSGVKFTCQETFSISGAISVGLGGSCVGSSEARDIAKCSKTHFL